MANTYDVLMACLLSPPLPYLLSPQVSEGPAIKKGDLDSSDAFILDTGAEVIVWIGKGASAGEKKFALQHAQDYLTKNGRPAYTPISRILEGGESDQWNNIFH
eukprot:TRINITY_DN9885_c0_g1_i2.p5 TRINITY_DN9885_c0_g1~~TRINITY_DN9885_c0_g1_i2.p5  ORF type:complete len:103 (-),score=33.29 TRINITY_DN9885_c0_g1_i2:102-410(-)